MQCGYAACRRTFRDLIARTLSCRSHSTSDGVSIRGAFEVPGFRLRETVETVAKFFVPPDFKVVAMFISDRLHQ